ncbi:hypothetical protein ACP70R_015651 [Stipagrostis hirtigluma subsp. patula]
MVFVVAFKNRSLELPEKTEEAQENCDEIHSKEVPRPSNGLNRIPRQGLREHRERWSLGSLQRGEGGGDQGRARHASHRAQRHGGPCVEPSARRLHRPAGRDDGHAVGQRARLPGDALRHPLHVPDADARGLNRLLVPLLRRRTGLLGGVTDLQRAGAGFLATVVAPAVAAVVERERRRTVAAGGGRQMSVFLLAPQFFLLGVAETMSFAGLLGFFSGEAPPGMKSIGVAFFWCHNGMSSLLRTLLVRLMNRATGGGHGRGWLEGRNLNGTRLDLFYWVVAAVALLGWLNFLYWAKRYRYRHDPRIPVKPVKEDTEP